MARKQTFNIIAESTHPNACWTFQQPASEIRFSAWRCFAYDGSAQEVRCFRLLGEHLCSVGSSIALYGTNEFSERLVSYTPRLRSLVKLHVTTGQDESDRTRLPGASVIVPPSLPPEIRTVFLCETGTFRRAQMRRILPPTVDVLCPDILTEIDWRAIPERAWIPAWDTIYPLEIPRIEVMPGQDVVLIDCPSKNMGLAPNGLAYVHNALRHAGLRFQTLDIDIIAYHRFHLHRLLDGPDEMKTLSGMALPDDPWAIENSVVWKDDATVEYFRPVLDEAFTAIVEAQPKILALSIHENNVISSKHLAERVKRALPETVILVGGYSCLDHRIGLRSFPLADYMIIGEADLTVVPTVNRILSGELLRNVPGVLSRYDSPERVFQPGAIPLDLDSLSPPRYEWASLDVYRNYNGYQLVPVLGSRGCRWSRCTFCTERFHWRTRTPANIVDEIEWLCERDVDNIMFNDSDLNGDPALMIQLCNEIIRRGLAVRLTGQLRIDKRNSSHFFDRMRKAGFVSLRFGVDGWCRNSLRIQKKGYGPGLIAANLTDCHNAEIFTEVNIVVGIPGETDADIEESIRNILNIKDRIGRFAVINPLMLKAGSDFWERSDEYNIHFKGDKLELRNKYPTGIPASLWYSTHPFIDERIRAERVELVRRCLRTHDITVGMVAETRIEEMRSGVDEMRGHCGAMKKGLNASGDTCRQRLAKYQPASPSEVVFRHGERFLVVPRSVIVELNDSGLLAKLRGLRTGRGLAALAQRVCTKLLGGLPAPQDEETDEQLLDFALRQKVLKLVKETPESILELILQGFHGYNIVKAGMEYFALKQGVPFDSRKFQMGEYERGVCLRGKSVTDVKRFVQTNSERFSQP